ncbi:hypothetical protein HPP92_017286 [Vanilla planifolia]|uniref:Uncharacterized protein n=1 Tax=Vanilla planifolia TaxID=51239 RepID=A0A835QFS4_VANPL|nr:hypothetical protein HPP92_017286 [Vanilla planifolia]
MTTLLFSFLSDFSRSIIIAKAFWSSPASLVPVLNIWLWDDHVVCIIDEPGTGRIVAIFSIFVKKKFIHG